MLTGSHREIEDLCCMVKLMELLSLDQNKILWHLINMNGDGNCIILDLKYSLMKEKDVAGVFIVFVLSFI